MRRKWVVVDLLLVADDLTGALDTGAQFAKLGLRTVVTWTAEPPTDTDVWVLDTGTRELAPEAAGQRIAAVVAPLLSQAPRLYKKVDSTLRGNIGAELAALLAASGARQAILAPAFPAQERMTLGGRQFVHGAPLDLTLPSRPGTACASILDLVRAQAGLTVSCLPLDVVRSGPATVAAAMAASAAQVLVIDAVEDADLRIIAQAASLAGPDRLLAGSAGLAAQLPVAWSLAATHDVHEHHERSSPAPSGARHTQGNPVPLPQAEPILLVAGTRHPCLAGQLARLAAEADVTVIGQVLAGLLARGQAVIAERGRILAAALTAGDDAVLTPCGEPQVAGGERYVAAVLAEITRQALQQAQPGALVLTGGEVTAAVCRALAARAIAVEGEVMPGIPWGRLLGGPAGGLPLVTKAGGFGGDDALWRILAALHGSQF